MDHLSERQEIIRKARNLIARQTPEWRPKLPEPEEPREMSLAEAIAMSDRQIAETEQRRWLKDQKRRAEELETARAPKQLDTRVQDLPPLPKLTTLCTVWDKSEQAKRWSR